jgi:hypothetical protein
MRSSGEGIGSAKMEFLAHFRKSRRQALRQRAQILMASMVYTPVYQIALVCQTDEAHVRRVIHAFNDFGFESLNPKVGTGRPRRLSRPSASGSSPLRWRRRRRWASR